MTIPQQSAQRRLAVGRKRRTTHWLTALCAAAMSVIIAPRPAAANLFSVLDAADGTVYAIFANQSYDESVLTQLVATSGAGIGQTSATASTLSSYEWGTAALFPVIGQSAIIPSAVITGFNTSGSGLLTFLDGTTVGVGDLLAFTGTATTLLPAPPGSYPPPYNVYGFGLPPGGHPTTTLASYGPPPLDGIGIGMNQAIVFGISPPPGVGRTIGFGSFSFRSNQAILASAGSHSFPGPRQPPIVPEPASFILLGMGLIGSMRRALRRRCGAGDESNPATARLGPATI